MTLLYEVLTTGRFMDTESRTDATRSWRMGTEGLLFNGKGRGGGEATLSVCLMSLNCLLTDG